MRSKVLLFVLSFYAVVEAPSAYAAQPVVWDLQVRRLPHSQQVEITYDVEDVDGDTLWVRAQVANHGGPTSGLPGATSSADVGAAISPGRGKEIRGDAGTDVEQADGDRDQVNVIARDSLELGDVAIFALPGGAALEMVWIEPGAFRMGTTEEQKVQMIARGLWDAWFENEQPAHEVTISRGFWLGKYEITQKQWASVTGSGVQYPDRPKVDISWNDVQAFTAELNKAEDSKVYRLPTEAEWEYACRAGTTTLWSFGDDADQLGEHAWYWGNTCYLRECYAHAVGTKPPNPWGVYDMYGNVSEWVQDGYQGDDHDRSPSIDPPGAASDSLRIVRGGHFSSFALYGRSAYRCGYSPSHGDGSIGARVLRQGP